MRRRHQRHDLGHHGRRYQKGVRTERARQLERRRLTDRLAASPRETRP